jgi:hypothetical protein
MASRGRMSPGGLRLEQRKRPLGAGCGPHGQHTSVVLAQRVVFATRRDHGTPPMCATVRAHLVRVPRPPSPTPGPPRWEHVAELVMSGLFELEGRSPSTATRPRAPRARCTARWSLPTPAPGTANCKASPVFPTSLATTGSTALNPARHHRPTSPRSELACPTLSRSRRRTLGRSSAATAGATLLRDHWRV